jgi:hypothetical protein
MTNTYWQHSGRAYHRASGSWWSEVTWCLYLHDQAVWSQIWRHHDLSKHWYWPINTALTSQNTSVFSNSTVRTSNLQFTYPLTALKCWYHKWHTISDALTYCNWGGRVCKTDIKHCIQIAFSTLRYTRNSAPQTVVKYCILMVYFASCHNVYTKIYQWTNPIKKKKTKKPHTASHQRVAEQIHISDNFIYFYSAYILVIQESKLKARTLNLEIPSQVFISVSYMVHNNIQKHNLSCFIRV